MGKYVVDCAILPVVEIVFLCCLFFLSFVCCFCCLKLPIATYYKFSLNSVYYYKYSVILSSITLAKSYFI